MLETKRQSKAEVANHNMSAKEKIAIAGVNRMSALLASNDHFIHENGKRPIGLIKVEGVDNGEDVASALQVLGSLEDLKAITLKHEIGKLLLAVDPRDTNRLHTVINACERENILFELVPDLYDVEFGGAAKSVLADFFSTFSFSIRRFFDLSVTALLMLILTPVWLVIALLIKLDSGGKVHCSQEFVGKDGKFFRAFRFRTIAAESDKYRDLPIITDLTPVRTRFGRFLHRSGLDQLPLLLNVLAGDMSLIGPEPERPYYHEKYMREVPFYRNRLKMRPGIIGYAQVNLQNRYSIENIREKLRYDFYYVDHSASPFLNLKIIFMALKNVALNKVG